jgi:biotin-[acetyl-CoA-carboxylase] ligase BirA-like protein
VTSENDTNWSALSTLPTIAAHYHYNLIESTNTQAKCISLLPQNSMVLLTACSQTQGRGQRNNSFFSSAPGNIYASIIFPVNDISNHFHCNRALCLAIIEALQHEEQGAPLSIKWPNDIYWNSKKICGILLESTPFSTQHIILGFGINVNIDHNAFPDELKKSATSFYGETGRTLNCPEALRSICNIFWNNVRIQPEILHKRYISRLFRQGSPVRINNQTGMFSTVLEDGRFGLKTAAEIIYFSAGSPEFL